MKVTIHADIKNYSKNQLVYSERYFNHSILLCDLLEDIRLYCITKVVNIINQFINGRFKVC
jgi:hypothetical protein